MLVIPGEFGTLVATMIERLPSVKGRERVFLRPVTAKCFMIGVGRILAVRQSEGMLRSSRNRAGLLRSRIASLDRGRKSGL